MLYSWHMQSLKSSYTDGIFDIKSSHNLGYHLKIVIKGWVWLSPTTKYGQSHNYCFLLTVVAIVVFIQVFSYIKSSCSLLLLKSNVSRHKSFIIPRLSTSSKINQAIEATSPCVSLSEMVSKYNAGKGTFPNKFFCLCACSSAFICTQYFETGSSLEYCRVKLFTMIGIGMAMTSIPHIAHAAPTSRPTKTNLRFIRTYIHINIIRVNSRPEGRNREFTVTTIHTMS